MSTVLIKPLFFLACSLPMLWIVGNALWGDLGANPVEAVTHQTGDWALRLLLFTLALTPLRKLSGWSWPLHLRRMSGLFVYFYASCHFLIWFVADHSMSPDSMFEDVLERPYISVGFCAFLMLTPLALSSNQWSMRRLGKRWKSLHRSVYLILLLVIIHFMWLVKADYLEPLVYATIGSILLLLRWNWKKPRSIPETGLSRR